MKKNKQTKTDELIKCENGHEICEIGSNGEVGRIYGKGKF